MQSIQWYEVISVSGNLEWQAHSPVEDCVWHLVPIVKNNKIMWTDESAWMLSTERTFETLDEAKATLAKRHDDILRCGVTNPPRWMDKPNAPGWWVCADISRREGMSVMLCRSGIDLSKLMPAEGYVVYGPIPEPRLERT